MERCGLRCDAVLLMSWHCTASDERRGLLVDFHFRIHDTMEHSVPVLAFLTRCQLSNKERDHGIAPELPALQSPDYPLPNRLRTSIPPHSLLILPPPRKPPQPDLEPSNRTRHSLAPPHLPLHSHNAHSSNPKPHPPPRLAPHPRSTRQTYTLHRRPNQQPRHQTLPRARNLVSFAPSPQRTHLTLPHNNPPLPKHLLHPPGTNHRTAPHVPPLHPHLSTLTSPTTTLYTLVPSHHLSSPNTPTTRVPAALQDAVTIYHHLLSTGIPSTSIILSGTSSGGHLVLGLLRYIASTSPQNLLP